MLIANVNGERTLASRGLEGFCPLCEKRVIAKCGTIKAHHWAHYGERDCDVWWEYKTPWHIDWQDKFPRHWQEIVRHAPSGERHIADVHTEFGLTIEFQYSGLSSEERAARENFYNNLVWVVSCTRLTRAAARFVTGISVMTKFSRKGVFLTPFPEKIFPRNWVNSAVPVLFDFDGAPGFTQATLPLAQPLWCLLPDRVHDRAVVLVVPRAAFIRRASLRAQFMPVKDILQQVEAMITRSIAKQTRDVRRSADPYGIPRTANPFPHLAPRWWTRRRLRRL